MNIPLTHKEILFQQKSEGGYRFEMLDQGAQRNINPAPGGIIHQVFGHRDITFHNDAKGGGSTDHPVNPETANAVEDTVVDTGLSANVNSTTRDYDPKHPDDPHPFGQAADINQIGGKRVDDPSNQTNVARFQHTASHESGVTRSLGPAGAFINPANGRQRQAYDRAKIMSGHETHVHVGTNPAPAN